MGKSKFAVSVAVIAGMFALTSTSTRAATFSVDCDAGEQIQPVLDGAAARDTVIVEGLCVEDIVVRVPGLRLQAGPAGGIIVGENASTSTVIQVRTRNVTISNLTVAFARTGIAITRTASATVDGGIIAQATTGIVISQASFGRVLGVFITQNSTGVTVNQASGADIADNVISDNTDDGIAVVESSAADIIGNTIQNNADKGVVVSRSAAADFAMDTSAGNTPNTISGNGVNGILCVNFSSVRFDLAQDFGTGNGATGTENLVTGSCAVSGSPI